MKFWPLSSTPRLWGALLVTAALTGCANMASHDKLATDMQTAGQSAGIPAALAKLEASATTPEEKAALLYNMERGELLRMDRRYDDSTSAFLLPTPRSRNGKKPPRPTRKSCWAPWAQRW